MLFLAGRSSKYSKTPAGLAIANVSRSDRGVYICRARLANTGQMEERKIEVEVSGGDCGASSCLSAVIIFPDQRTSALGSEAIWHHSAGRWVLAAFSLISRSWGCGWSYFPVKDTLKLTFRIGGKLGDLKHKKRTFHCSLSVSPKFQNSLAFPPPKPGKKWKNLI